MALVQSNTGSSAGVTNLTPSLPGATTAGNTILLMVSSAGTISTPSGFTSRSPQVNIQGCYFFEKLVASGNSTDTPTMAQGGTYNGTWIIAEYSGITAFRTSNGANSGFSANGSYSTGNVTPAAGATLLVAYVGVSTANPDTLNASDPQSFTNSFTKQASVYVPPAAGSGRDGIAGGWATNQVTANGSTAYSSGASFTASTNSGAPHRIIAAYAHSAGGAATSRPIFARPARFITRSF
jgi:hypothetical protein